MRQALETGAATIATGCPFCMTMISDGVNQKGMEGQVKVLDIAELVLQSAKPGPRGRPAATTGNPAGSPAPHGSGD